MLKIFRNIIPKSSFTRNVLTLMSGTTIAQAIPLAISPILTRIYSPEDFGEVETIMKLAGVFIAIAGLRYEMAIVVEENPTQAKDLLRLSLFLNFAMSFIIFIIILLFKNKIGVFFKLTTQIFYLGCPSLSGLQAALNQSYYGKTELKNLRKFLPTGFCFLHQVRDTNYCTLLHWLLVMDCFSVK